MGQYRTTRRLETMDGKLHEVGEIIQLDEAEAQIAIRQRAVIPVVETAAPPDPTPTATVEELRAEEAAIEQRIKEALGQGESEA